LDILVFFLIDNTQNVCKEYIKTEYVACTCFEVLMN